MSTTGPVLIAYDGSGPSEAAIDEVARLMPGAHAVLLYAHEPLETVAAHLQGHPALEQVRQIDATTGDASEALAERGAARARTAGLHRPCGSCRKRGSGRRRGISTNQKTMPEAHRTPFLRAASGGLRAADRYGRYARARRAGG